MKEGIHPNYEETTIRCACGNVIETGSTKKDIRVEVCSKCHPFYTGKQKMVDTGGRVSRFNKKFGLDKLKDFCLWTRALTGTGFSIFRYPEAEGSSRDPFAYTNGEGHIFPVKRRNP